MRHNKKINHLGRKSGHRKAMLANLASSLILHKRIETTVAKAKALRVYIEPLITKSKEDTTHSRRVVFSYIKQKEAVTELFRIVSPKIAERQGGYTRILKTGFRQGDAADMAIIELVDFNEAAISAAKQESKKSTTRRSRAKKAADQEAPAAGKAKSEVKKEKPAAKSKVEDSKPEDSKPEAEPQTTEEENPANESEPEVKPE
ncbi:MAG: 50S ribosomal protein L17 [Bacteroidales bacterium]|nr:50S ribosomal protein L17 [Bacteroidales bacterium]MDD2424999.1 50S ribosomal protein L17 [Bacteroidales bacterium]MDD3989360.1 50S ribosomal protein L17 [Bacteroidales bacterium]MDD4639044.1 50S ribosomal protein L17 [Bacteroidales bacterium]